MTKDQIEKLQAKLSQFYPTLNSGWCALFAYAFISRVGWKSLRIGSTWCGDMNEVGKIAHDTSSEHFVVEYDGMTFDWHQFLERDGSNVIYKDRKFPVQNERNKSELALSVMEWARNDRFCETEYMNGSKNKWDVIWTFLSDFESFLDRFWVEYSSWLWYRETTL